MARLGFIKDRTLAKMQDLNRKINDLTRLKATLEHLIAECYGHTVRLNDASFWRYSPAMKKKALYILDKA